MGLFVLEEYLAFQRYLRFPGNEMLLFFLDISLHFKRKVSLQQDGVLPPFWWAGNFTSQPQ